MLRARIVLRCPRCNSTSFRPEGKVGPEDTIVCGSCHTTVTYREAENATLANARRAQQLRALSRNFGKS
jgi:hypothetical protein